MTSTSKPARVKQQKLVDTCQAYDIYARQGQRAVESSLRQWRLWAILVKQWRPVQWDWFGRWFWWQWGWSSDLSNRFNLALRSCWLFCIGDKDDGDGDEDKDGDDGDDDCDDDDMEVHGDEDEDGDLYNDDNDDDDDDLRK